MARQRREGADRRQDPELALTVNVIGFESMRAIARGLSVLYAFYAIAYLWAPGSEGRWMAIISAVTALVYAVSPAVLDRVDPPVERRSVISMVMTTPVYVNVLAALALSRNPVFTCFVMLAVVASGAFLDRLGHLALVTAVAFGGWLAVALTSPPSDDWATAGFAMFSSGAVALLIFRVRLRMLNRLSSLQAELRASASNDDLTGLCNRRGFLLRAEQARHNADSAGQPMTLLFIDINGFKAVNDTEGHAHGDAVLVALALALRSAFRDRDILGRLGGDEFCVLVPGTRETELTTQRVRAAALVTPEIPSLSIGASVYEPGTARPITALISEADQRMYREKHGHRSPLDPFDGTTPDRRGVPGPTVTRR